MQIREMKPNTEYATCDGALVVTLDTVERGWFMFTETVEDKNTKQDVSARKIEQGDPRKNIERADPWASCGTRPSHRRLRMEQTNGVRVRLFANDRNGKRTGAGVDWVMNPTDIPGLWSDYVLLHGDKIEAKFARADLEAEGALWARAATDVLEKAGIKVRTQRYSGKADDRNAAYISVGVTPDYDVNRGKPLVLTKSIEFEGNALADVLNNHANLNIQILKRIAELTPTKTPRTPAKKAAPRKKAGS